MNDRDDLPVPRTLREPAEAVQSTPHPYVRWSGGPEADEGLAERRDGPTGKRLPGTGTAGHGPESYAGCGPGARIGHRPGCADTGARGGRFGGAARGTRPP